MKYRILGILFLLLMLLAMYGCINSNQTTTTEPTSEIVP